MAASLSIGDKKAMLTDFKLLFGRALDAMPCPLGNAGDICETYNAMFPQEVRDAFVTLNQYDFLLNAHLVTSAEVMLEIDGREYQVRLSPSRAFALLTDPNPLRRGFITFNQHNQSKLRPQIIPLSSVLDDKCEDFYTWVKRTAVLNDEIVRAHECISKIIEMAGTAGQLKRMAPLLAQWLPAKKYTHLTTAIRASNFPFDWAKFDRRPIEPMLATMAKCHLMPKGEKEWGESAAAWAVAIEAPDGVAT